MSRTGKRRAMASRPCLQVGTGEGEGLVAPRCGVGFASDEMFWNQVMVVAPLWVMCFKGCM